MAREGITLFVTTHYMEEAEHCHRLGFIFEGKIIALDSPRRIKERFSDTIVEVVCDDQERVLALMDKNPRVKNAYLYGPAVHVNFGDFASSEDEARKTLTGAGLCDIRATPVTPSLEDVFVSLIEQAGAR